MQLTRTAVGIELDNNAFDSQRHHVLNASKSLREKHRGNTRQGVLALQYQHLEHDLQLVLKNGTYRLQDILKESSV